MDCQSPILASKYSFTITTNILFLVPRSGYCLRNLTIASLWRKQRLFYQRKNLAVYRLHQNVFVRMLIGESSIVYEPAFKPCTDYVILLEVKRHNLCKSSYAVPHSITLIIP